MYTPRSNRRKSKICYKEEDSPSPKKKSNHSVKKNVIKYRVSELNVDNIPSQESDESNNEVNDPLKISGSDDSACENAEKNVVSGEVTEPRRGTRIRHKTALAVEAEKSIKRLDKLSLNESGTSSQSEDEHSTHFDTPTFLEGDVEGKKMFRFKTVHRKQDMARKAMAAAAESPSIRHSDSGISRTPRTPLSVKKGRPLGTPSKGRLSLNPNTTPRSARAGTLADKTPHHVRNKMKKRLQAMAESDGSDFSNSESDFQPSDDDDDASSSSDDEDSESKENNSSDSEASSKKKPVKKTKQPEKAPAKPYSLRQKRNVADDPYTLKPDNYFSMYGNKKITTSNHTLERLKTPRLTEEKLEAILKNQKLSKEHQIAIQELVEDNQQGYDKWLFILDQGFSIILHGLGSKLKIIQDFQKQKLSKHPCIVVNGFFPSLTIKDILESIVSDLFKYTSTPANVYDAVELIEREMESMPDEKLFLLIHNIDGEMLRSDKAQDVLSKLAKINNIHLVASLDHINAPMIWDPTKLSNFNFSWWDVSTFLPYSRETCYDGTLLVRRGGALAMASLRSVFQSLTSNARGIFHILANNQLKNRKTPHFQGITFKDLYWSARESFLVSSDLALRAQLTEFLDHKLVKAKRSADGNEHLLIPLDSKLLQEFMDQNENED